MIWAFKTTLQKGTSYRAPTALTVSCCPLAFCHCTFQCRCPPAGQLWRRFPRRVGSAPPNSEWVAGSAGIRTWWAGFGTGPAGAPRLTGASGDDKSGRRTGQLSCVLAWSAAQFHQNIKIKQSSVILVQNYSGAFAWWCRQHNQQSPRAHPTLNTRLWLDRMAFIQQTTSWMGDLTPDQYMKWIYLGSKFWVWLFQANGNVIF